MDVSKQKTTMSMNLTFKKEEEWLWKRLCQKSSKSAFVKDVLKEHFKREDEGSPQPPRKPTLPNINSLKGV